LKSKTQGYVISDFAASEFKHHYFEILCFISLSEIGVDVLCLSPASIGNFIVEDDESSGK